MAVARPGSRRSVRSCHSPKTLLASRLLYVRPGADRSSTQPSAHAVEGRYALSPHCLGFGTGDVSLVQILHEATSHLKAQISRRGVDTDRRDSRPIAQKGRVALETHISQSLAGKKSRLRQPSRFLFPQ